MKSKRLFVGTARDKSKILAIQIVKTYQYLCNEKREYVLSKQLLKSGTSIGANLTEAECAISRNDFLSKVYIALKETVETIYWLELLNQTDYLPDEQYEKLRSEADEIRKMLSSTTRTIRSGK